MEASKSGGTRVEYERCWTVAWRKGFLHCIATDYEIIAESWIYHGLQVKG